MSEKLKPCPFCGGTKICTEKGINLNYCDNCSAESNVERWNTRPIEDELRAENVRLNSWLDEVIKQGNYLEHTLRLAYEHVNGHAFVHGWRDMVNHIQKEREE